MDLMHPQLDQQSGLLQYSPKIIHAQEVVQEVKMWCFAVCPQELLETQEVEYLSTRNRKKL